MAESNIKLRVDARDAVNALQRTNRATTQLNQTLGTTNKRTATATANIQRFGISFRSVVGPMVALTGAVTLASRSLNTFANREAELKVLSAQLARIGTDGTNQLDTLKAAADRLGDATLFSQDDFIQAFNVLSSFRAIAVTSFTEVSEVAADIAQVMGTDVKSATVQLAKALEDPKRGLTALSRSGITFNETQTETIKKLVDSGKSLEAQNLILETIKGQYEGAATAAGTGFAGAQDLLAENTADLTEALGKGLEPAAAAVTTKFAELAGLLSKIPAPAGQAALAIGGVALALKAVNTAIIVFKGSQLAAFIGTQIALYKTFEAQIYLTAAAQGVLNKALALGRLALLALPFAAVAGAATFFIADLVKAQQEQANFNSVLETGTKKMLENALATERANLARAESFVLQGRGEGREAFQAPIKRAKLRIAQLEAKLLGVGVVDPPVTLTPKPKPKTTSDSSDVDQSKTDPGITARKNALEALQADRDRLAIAFARNEEEARMIDLQQRIRDVRAQEELVGKKITDDRIQAIRSEFTVLEVKQFQQKRNEEIADQQQKNAENLKKAQEAEAERIKQLAQRYQGIADTIANGVVDALKGAVMGTQTLAESASNLLNNLANDLLMVAKNMLFFGGTENKLSKGKGLLGNLFSGFLADGGTATGGRSFIVGERGPELFTPGRTGSVTPNSALGGSNIVVNVDASGSSVEGDGNQATQLGKAIGIAVQQELIKQKRPGGLLTR
mgnify:CR=1 FL=1